MSKETTRYHKVRERNSWEGETWFHYFMDDDGVQDALAGAVANGHDLSLAGMVDLTEDAETALANEDDGEYMQKHWFGRLTDPDGLSLATNEQLYKGGIRKYGESLFEAVQAPAAEPGGAS